MAGQSVYRMIDHLFESLMLQQLFFLSWEWNFTTITVVVVGGAAIILLLYFKALENVSDDSIWGKILFSKVFGYLILILVIIIIIGYICVELTSAGGPSYDTDPYRL